MKKPKPDIHRLLEFQQLLQEFQAVERIVHIASQERHENDTEHSYNLAMTAWYLGEHFPELDQNTLIRFALVHDLVEVYAGDTYVFADQAHLDGKAEREAAAIKQLAAKWADFPSMLQTIHDYEQRTSKEAQFIYALDKIMPVMLIYLAEGRTWHEENISYTKLHTNKREKVKGSAIIEDYYRQLHELLVAQPRLFPR